VLQPPRIRHRVLESSPGLEVVEVACPAEHDTCLDHELALPTPAARPGRDFGGQRFVHHVASTATWRAWPGTGCEQRDLGLDAATGGLASARVVRRAPGAQPTPVWRHAGELLFLHVLAGALDLDCAAAGALALRAGDGAALPPGPEHALVSGSDDLELLELRLG
jgi:quercetin dioxygenase-like cupin family protein